MSEPYNSLLVNLRMDLREEEIKPLIEAIALLRGVLNVVPNETNMFYILSEERAQREQKEKLWKVLSENDLL